MKKNNEPIFVWGEEAHVTSGPSHEIKAGSMANHCTEEVNLR